VAAKNWLSISGVWLIIKMSGSEMNLAQSRQMKKSPSASPARAGDTAPERAASAGGVRRRTASRPGLERAVLLRQAAAFTLVEVVVAVAVIALTFAVVVYGYLRTADRAEWSAYSLAAQSLAMQGVEQARAAKWDPQAWPVVDELGATNLVQVEPLDVPVVREPVMATNYISVTTVSANPPLRQLRADCVWSLKGRPAGIAGPFTNTTITLRAPDQ